MTEIELIAWLLDHGWSLVPERCVPNRVTVERRQPNGRILSQQYVYEPTLLGHRWRVEQRRTRAAPARVA